MNCERTQLLLHPYLDGELDLVQSLEVVDHLNHCAACERTRAQVQSVRQAIANSDLRHAAPPALAERIRNSLAPSERRVTREVWRREWFPMALVAAAVVAAVLFGITFLPRSRSSEEFLAREVATAHVRSLLASHLVDVGSSDRHTVKPWFVGKLDFAASVVDLTDHGFELVGGRLDVLEEHPVAALVYRKRKHTINIFFWPDPSVAPTQLIESTRRGYTLFHWAGAGQQCWVISDLNTDELREFAAAFRERLEQPIRETSAARS